MLTDPQAQISLAELQSLRSRNSIKQLGYGFSAIAMFVIAGYTFRMSQQFAAEHRPEWTLLTVTASLIEVALGLLFVCVFVDAKITRVTIDSWIDYGLYKVAVDDKAIESEQLTDS